MSAMHKLQSVRLPHGPAHDKVEALVLAARTAKMCLKTAEAKPQLFVDCHTIGKLVGKLGQCMPDRWFHYREVSLQQPEKVSFEAWLIQEANDTAQQRKCTLADKYKEKKDTDEHTKTKA